MWPKARRVFEIRFAPLLIALAIFLSAPTLAHAVNRDVRVRFNPSPGAVSYRIHIGIGPGAYIRVDEVRAPSSGSATITQRVAGLPDDLAAYVAVTAVDARGQESRFSREIIVPASRPGGMCFFDSQCFNGRPIACKNKKCSAAMPLAIEAFASNVAAPQPPRSRVLFGVQAKGGSGEYEYSWQYRMNGGPWVTARDFDRNVFYSLDLPSTRGMLEIGVFVRNVGDSDPGQYVAQVYPYQIW